MNAAFTPKFWSLAHGRTLTLGERACLMGIVNVTPDSFSDGGRYSSVEQAVESALQMVEEGAQILDIGGESTRPGSAIVDCDEECRRVLPVISKLAEMLAARADIVISIDTYRAKTARLALEAGAHIVNDVWGLQRELEIAEVAAGFGAGVCIMHNGRDREVLADPVEDQRFFLSKSLAIAKAAGIADHSIVLDPGFGFAKETAAINLELMARFEELHALGFPLLAGTSRKRFIGEVTGREAKDRDVGTAATSVLLRLAGAAIFRVHNVAINSDALKITDAMIKASRPA